MNARFRAFAVSTMAVAVVGVGAVSNSASAWQYDELGNFTYRYYSNAYKQSVGGDAGGPHGFGSETSWGGDDKDLAGTVFREYGPGKGQAVKNNAGSVYNETDRVVRVYYNSYAVMGCWCGSRYDDARHGRRDLSSTYNDNASHHMRNVAG